MRACSGTRGPNTVSYSRKERVCMTRPQQSGTGKDFFPCTAAVSDRLLHAV